MPPTPIQCANCGAKYRLPETFQADKAKCKKCGAMIDVAGQRATPTAAKPAAAKPAAATASSTRRSSPARRSRRPDADGEEGAPSKRRSSRRSSARSSKSDDAPSRTRRGSRGRGDGDDEGEGDEPRRGRREPKKSNTALIAGSVIGVLAVVLVVIIFVMQGDDEQPADATQEASAPKEPEPVDTSSDRRAAMRLAVAELAEADRIAIEKFLDAAESGDAELEAVLAEVGNEAILRFASDSLKIAGADAEASKLAKMAKTPELSADQRQQVVAVVAELAKSKTDPDSQVLAGMLLGVEPKAEPAVAKKPKKRKKAELTSHEDVFKPRDELEPLPWPEFVNEEEQTEITEALAAMKDGGIAGKRAKTRLEELDAKSVVGIVNQLAALNYFDSEDTMFAYELNRLLGAMAAGVINAGFRPCELGSEISLEDADWNGKTVKAWRRFAEKYGEDEDSLQRLRKKRRSKPGR